MRYVIGVKIYNKITEEENEYLCIFSKFGYPSTQKIESIEQNLDDGTIVKTILFETAEEAQENARELCKHYRRDNVSQKEKIWQKSQKIITFYPIKIDNNKFPFLVEQTKEKTDRGNIVYRFKKKRR